MTRWVVAPILAIACGTPPATGHAVRPERLVAISVTTATAASPSPAAPLRPAAATAASAPEVALDIPLIAQTLNLDCEAASLQMALSYKGIKVAQAALLAGMRPDYARPLLSGGRVVSWSDPYDHFVGDPAGHEYDHTGYGVYFPVVAAAARQHGARVAWAGEGFSWSSLEQLVGAGDPAVVWIAYDGSAYRADGPVYDYRAGDGRSVPYAPGFEHTVVVAEVTADGVLVDNPRWGHRDWLTRAQFTAATAPFGDMAVVIS